MNFCPKCGAENVVDLNYCTNCGFDFREISVNNHYNNQQSYYDGTQSIESIPKKDVDEINSHLHFRHNSKLVDIKERYDDKTYRVIDNNRRILTVKIGNGIGFTTSKIISNNSNDNSVDREVSGGNNKNKYLVTGFIFGLLSLFLFEIGIIPLAGFVINLIGLIKFDSIKENNFWMGVVGILLCGIYFTLNIYLNGHLG